MTRLTTFEGCLIAIEQHHIHARAELLRKQNSSDTRTDWVAEASKEADAGDVQHWLFLSPIIEARYLETSAAIKERSNPPNYGAADQLRRQARALRANISERSAA